MATPLLGAKVLLGSSAADASQDRLALAEVFPFVAWTVPNWFFQRRFSIRIDNIEPGGWAYTTSGPRTSTEHSFRFPEGVQLNENFAGLCKVTVLLSAQLEGEFEYSIEHRFVYERSLEALFNAGVLRVWWQAATNPDFLPTSGQRRFHLQIGTDVDFTDLVYNNELIFHNAGPIVEHSVPGVVWGEQQTYVYRVRQHDGLDWGEWSITNAFTHSRDVPGLVSILDVIHTGNAYGDVLITIEISDQDTLTSSVSFEYGVLLQPARWPLSFITPPLVLPRGISTLVWRSNRDIVRSIQTNVILYARTVTSYSQGPLTQFGPFTIDNRYIPYQEGGTGNLEFTFPVSGALIKLDVDNPISDNWPVAGQLAPVVSIDDITNFVKMQHRVACDPIIRPLAHMIARLERSNSAGAIAKPGWENDDVLPKYYWPTPISAAWGADSTFFCGFPSTNANRPNPHASATSFLFADPSDYTGYADAWPRPHSSQEMALKPCLIGWEDADGNTHEYPDGYDVANRPASHYGHEVYAADDAWVQEMQLEYTDHPPCTTCDGRSWVPSLTAPYTREPCPNENCVDGFDHSEPHFQATRGTQSGIKAYLVPRWRRISKVLTGTTLPIDNRLGMPIHVPEIDKMMQHVVGRHYSHLDTVEGTPTLEWSLSTDKTIGGITRQPEDAADVAGYVYRGGTILNNVALNAPAQGKLTIPTEFTPEVWPTQGNLAPLSSDFFWGTDPDSHPGHSLRPRPTQDWNIGVQGNIWRDTPAQTTQFRFLQPAWEAYNTLHFQGTPSETIMFHLQVARRLEGGSLGPWTDLKGDNCQFVPSANVWMVPPMVMHMYWDSQNRALYPINHEYQLRIRQYDTVSHQFTDWVYSTAFDLVENTPNPISILSLYYEPWSKNVEITFRVDDSEQDTYNLTRFWYSEDDGNTWIEISSGDIFGRTSNLQSNPSNDGNVHTIWWRTIGRSLGPGQEYRVQIECLPSNIAENLVIPVLKWYVPRNPGLDQAEASILRLLGYTQYIIFDENTQTWSIAEDPIYVPGEMQELEDERDRVCSTGMWDYCSPSETGAYLRPYITDATGTLPTGWYLAPGYTLAPLTKVYTRWAITDETGFSSWRSQPWQESESRGQALTRINKLLHRYATRELPQAYTAVRAAEVWCRKDLINQAYYAEAYFQQTNGEYDDTVLVDPIAKTYTNEGSLPENATKVRRFWRFKTQLQAEGPSGIYDEYNLYAPTEITNLEQVYFEVQLDGTSTFDSQPAGMPLRDLIVDHTGHRIAVASLIPGDPINFTSATDATAPGPGTSWDAYDNVLRQNPPAYDTVGGQVKIQPSLLPGEVATDVLPQGQAAWEGEYVWRVSSYNPVYAPQPVLPRPRIVSWERIGEFQESTMYIYINMAGHPALTGAYMPYTIIMGYETPYYRLENFLEFSLTTTTPAWSGFEELVCVSDQRAPLSSGAETTRMYWVPTAQDRPHPTIYYDNDLHQYVMATAQKGLSGQWRISTYRSVGLPTICEYDALFDNRPETSIYGPCLLKVAGTVRMYFTGGTAGGNSIMLSTSPDADNWTIPQQLAGFSGQFPWVCYRDDVYHMWYQKVDVDNLAKVYHATSTDGIVFTDHQLVYSIANHNVLRPAIVWFSNQWRMFFTDSEANCIASVTSADGISWASYQVEASARSIAWDGGAPITANPNFACPYFDLYRGNEELFLMLNYINPSSGEARIFYQRLEDRTDWTLFMRPEVVSDKESALVRSSPTGEDTTWALLGVMFSPDITNLKMRILLTDELTPTTIEARRRGGWVHAGNLAVNSAYMKPLPWYYDETLLNYPYMRLANE